MYRFRSIKGLLDDNDELKNQEIYFASPEELNDPREGYNKVVWNGDRIIWRNFFKHYILTLYEEYSVVSVLGEEYDLKFRRINIERSIEEFRIEIEKENFNTAWKYFSEESIIVKLIDFLSKRESLSTGELLGYLEIVHGLAIKSIDRVSYEVHECSVFNTNIIEAITGDALLQLGTMMENDEFKGEVENLDVAIRVSKNVKDELHLLKIIKRKYTDISNGHYIIFNFPSEYLKQIQRLSYPKWYAACFSKECTNVLMWSHYAYGHTGVCLKFRDIEEKNNINLNIISNHPHNSKNHMYEYHGINYSNSEYEVNFFESLGSARETLLSDTWYKNENGIQPECAKNVFNDKGKWHREYWHKFYKFITTKTEYWSYEDETRLIIDETFYNYSEKETRVWNYKFEDLEGIIFGSKTSTKDKIRIIEIIQVKCKKYKREEFSFYQAEINNNKVIVNKMNFLSKDIC